MTEDTRIFGIGDSVISLCSLPGPPVEPHAYRPDIKSGSRGTVLDVRVYDYPKPYTVAFEDDDGSLVEVEVAEHQLGRVRSHNPLVKVPAPSPLEGMPPLRVRRPPRRSIRYEPSLLRPHRLCTRLHAFNMLMYGGIYSMGLLASTRLVITGTLLVLAFFYGRHYQVNKSWAWIPDGLKPDEPSDHEDLVINPLWADRAAVLDLVYGAALFSLLAYYVYTLANHYRVSLVPYPVILGCLFIGWTAQTYAHDRAARIMPRN